MDGAEQGAGASLREWLLRPAPRVWCWLSAATLLAVAVSAAIRSPAGGLDNAFVVKAADALLAGHSPYADKRFLYLPSAVLMAVPEALLPEPLLRWAAPLGTTGLVLAGWWCALRIFAVPSRSRLAVLGFLGLALLFRPYGNLVLLSNWTCVSAAALPAALLLAQRGRWPAAGLVVGVAVACKPMLVPLALLFVFARQWRALAAMGLVPAVTSLLGALLMPSPLLFVTKTVPFLLKGQDSFALPWDASPVAIGPRLGLPQPVALALAAAGALAGLWCARRRWHRDGPGPGSDSGYRPVSGLDVDEGQRLAETASMVMLAAFLVSRPSFDHYLLVVLPLLLASGLRPDSAPRSPWFWVSLVPQALAIPFVSGGHTRAFKDCFTLCALAGTLMWRCARPGRVILGPVTTAGSPPRTEPECAATPAEPASRTAF
ncbi:glycosyltransferase family 87 protein [Streptomyces sp. NPDC002073]|uniref:glycosyltransferase family 87 protein n=1 Tax=Streptomyces sp. NBC_00239 TaxID=2903640 RepID=UPI002E2A414E|nr:glycosyltransferase family 87 protein [Streptomyces sp. NBC_00239]